MNTLAVESLKLPTPSLLKRVHLGNAFDACLSGSSIWLR